MAGAGRDSLAGAVRLLLLNQFYPPDAAPTGRFLRDLVFALAERGHDVDVLTSRARYASGTQADDAAGHGRVRVRRIGRSGSARGSFGRIAHDLAFLRDIAGMRCEPPPDLVLALASPPFLGVAAARLARRHRARLAHWVMDVYPDALVAQGWLRAWDPACALLRVLARRAHAAADLVVTLGPHMAARVRPLAGAARLVEVPLWADAHAPADDEIAMAARVAHGWERDALVLLYSGNLGRGHLVEEFLEAARRLGPSGPRWVFAGGGAQRARVEAFRAAQPRARVELLPYAEPGAHTTRLMAADAHLASLSSRWQGVIAPSKVQAAFGLARPLLFVGGDACEPAEWVRASGGGWVCAEGDIAGLLAAVEQASDACERRRRGASARAFARAHFDRERNLGRLVDALEAAARG